MTPQSTRARRFVVQLALLFALVQAVAVWGVLLVASMRLRGESIAPVLGLGLLAVDFVALFAFARWAIRVAVSRPIERLSANVLRIADGEYHHRLGDAEGDELAGIHTSVNRLADRLIEDQRLLAANIESLEQTNRELRAARDQVIRSARLASVGTLAAGIAHEVGNPLGAVLGFVDVARGRAQAAGGDLEILDSIRNEAKRIDRIVRGLLDYARPRAADGGPSTAGEVVQRVHALLDSQGKLLHIDDSWDYESAASRVVLEPHRLEQVLINLVLNALHAVRGQPDPRVTVRLVEESGALGSMPARREDDPPGINYMHRRRWERDQEGVASSAAADRLLVLEVSDNGHGIPTDSLDQVFDPFFTTKEPGEGTGLGLAICARLIDGMGGEIEALHNPGGGARFVIRLPIVYDIALESPVTDEAEHA